MNAAWLDASPWLGQAGRVDRSRALEGAEVVRFEPCGHSPELEDPPSFVDWRLRWVPR